jgi:3-hydroxyacyl-[acyl-carrier-protein] dehydratase
MDGRDGGMGTAEIADVLSLLPHRYPMLLVDRVEAIVPGVSASGIKAVTINEPFFQGHFPARPIMPGVLIVEALAQTAGVLAIRSLGLKGSGKLVFFLGIEEAKFRRPVEPGCLLRLEVRMVQTRRSVSRFDGVARVGETVAAEARFSAMVADPPG